MTDVLVIGAGLAGLQCARVLTQAGRDVTVVEASDEIGGRVRTEVVDGFRCDRGFQVLNPAYPDARSQLDLAALDLHAFGRGVRVRRGSTTVTLGLSRQAMLAVARSPYADPRALAALGRWLAPALGPVPRLLANPDATLVDSLDAAGLSGPLRTEILEPFLAGVLLDQTGATSARFARLLARSFTLGTPALPSQGMTAIPHQLASHLHRPVRLGTPVTELAREGGRWVAQTPHGELSAPTAVVATDPATAGALAAVPVPSMKGLVTWWFATEAAPTTSRYLLLEGRGFGPIVNTAVMSNVAPSYAPAGQHLVQASAVLGADDEVPSVETVRTQLAHLYEVATGDWHLLTTHVVRNALPAMPPPLTVRDRIRFGDGLYVCGDHRDTASIQGALVSGRRTAEAILAH